MTPEGKVKEEIKKVLKKTGIWYYMPVQNGMGVVGIPDFMCCADGKFIGVEAKAPGKIDNLTPNQKRIRDQIQESAGWYIAVDDAEHFKAVLAMIMKRRIE